MNEIQIKLANILQDHYAPLDDPSSPKRLFLGTKFIFDFLQSRWPSDQYTVDDVVTVLKYLKVDCVTNAKVVWLLEAK